MGEQWGVDPNVGIFESEGTLCQESPRAKAAGAGAKVCWLSAATPPSPGVGKATSTSRVTQQVARASCCPLLSHLAPATAAGHEALLWHGCGRNMSLCMLLRNQPAETKVPRMSPALRSRAPPS